MSRIEPQSFYSAVAARITAEREAGRLPSLQPWDAARCPYDRSERAVAEWLVPQ